LRVMRAVIASTSNLVRTDITEALRNLGRDFNDAFIDPIAGDALLVQGAVLESARILPT